MNFCKKKDDEILETLLFIAYNEPRAVRSHHSWWSGYNVLWGTKTLPIGNIVCILVPEADYRNLLIFVNKNNNESNHTYQMNITRVKSWCCDYWTLSNFKITKKFF